MRRAALLVAALWAGIGAQAAMAQSTTERRTVIGDEAATYSELNAAPGWERQVREDLAAAKPGRVGGRRSPIYFSAIDETCVKVFAPFTIGQLTTSALFTSPERVLAVPPDPNRRSLSYPEFRAVHATGRQADAHGFAFVDPEKLTASNGAASYYAWTPKPGMRFARIQRLPANADGGPG